jgi:siroheme synthase-like protein
MAAKYLPINLSISNLKILVIGGGNVALRKIDTLLDYGADITCIALQPVDRVDYFGSSEKIRLEKRAYQAGECANFGLVISASDNKLLNTQIHEECAKAGVLVNVVDNPRLCTFTFPATLRRDCLSLAISPDGKAPFLSAHLRQILDSIFPKHWEKIARLATEYRKMAQERWKDDLESRTAALDNFLAADWKTMIKEKKEEALHQEMEQLLEIPEVASNEQAE